ncbi:MAG: N-6 DNA methylase [Opitutaceae bacterium]|jgi:tRNA1(Val) A37 N6-methylase TrmN6
MPIPASIAERVETFRRNLDSYLAADYKELELRREFLDPLFKALGWDVDNSQGHAEAYKDVVHEDMLKINGQSTAPDYSFRIGGNRKFFVEAKKPAVRIKDDPAPAAQLRRYSWTAKLPLGIATDFQEFAIYDTRIRPRADDKASTGRIFYCTYEEFALRWDEIAAIFSKDAVLKGSFDKYAATNRGKRGTSGFDDDFLADLENWRQLLAVNLAKRNTLDERELNFAVQRILDRIVFLRIAEDRGIEPLGQLQALTAGPRLYPRLREIFERADFRYNSGLFHFANEKGRDESPDRLTLGLDIDDAVLKEVLAALYWPRSPYAFAVVSADILGHVYEQFLGKVIQLDGPHKVKVEEKPEVRKAGGVYYTPTYIVDYIVRQTVGPLVDGKTPKQIEKIRVLDPACGSGSFLLGAYDFLLAWYLDYYAKNDPAGWAKKKQPPIYETSPNAHGVGKGNGGWRLTTAERKRILVTHIYGVDIDTQAVEVTKLSLLLKVLEGEARELQGKQMDFHRVLPDLGNNIKCGNSLIGPDFYAQADLPELDDEARYKLNVFDWAEEFKPVMSAGGFDAVIGNPPYGAELTTPDTRYLNARFDLQSYQLDSYLLFLEQAFFLAAKEGRVGVIIPNTWLLNLQTIALRRRVFSKHTITEIVHYLTPVFKGVTVDTEVCIFERQQPGPAHEIRISFVKDKKVAEQYGIPQTRWKNADGGPVNIRERAEVFAVSERMQSLPKLDTWFLITQGAKPFQVGKGKPKQTRAIVDEKPFVSEICRDKTFRPLLRGSLIHRYRTLWKNDYWISLGDWLAEPRYSANYDAPEKIVIRQTGDSFVATLDRQQFVVRDNLYTILGRGTDFTLGGLLGLLNSRFLNWFYQNVINPEKGEALAQVKRGHLAAIPLPFTDLKKKSDRAHHDQLVALVERMLKLHADVAVTKSPDVQTRLQREIKATDTAIDQLVYQLYELTPEEIALVEAATAPVVKAVEAEAAVLPESAYAQAEVDAAHHYTLDEDSPAKS